MDNVATLEGIESHWQELLLHSDTPSAFATPEAAFAWYRHVKDIYDIYVITVWNDAELVGLAPFSLTRLGSHRGPAFYSLTTAGAEYGYRGDPLLGSDPLTTAESIANHLATLVSSGRASVNLRRLWSDSALLSSLTRRTDISFQQTGSQRAHSIVHFNQIEHIEAYLRRVARHGDLDRRRRRLDELFQHVEFLPEDPHPDVALDTMCELLLRRFGRDSGPSLMATPTREHFTRSLINQLCVKGYGQMSSIIADGRRIAVSVLTRVGQHVFWYMVAHDPELKKFGLGNLILLESVRSAHAAGASEIDLGSAKFAYKEQWASTERYYHSVSLTASGLRGQITRPLRRAATSYGMRRFNKLDGLAEGNDEELTSA